MLASCWPSLGGLTGWESPEDWLRRLTNAPGAVFEGWNLHIVVLERLPSGSWQAMPTATLVRALKHGRLLPGSWTAPTLGQVIAQHHLQTHPACRSGPATSSSLATPSDSLAVRPLFTFFGPLGPLEPHLKDPSREGRLSTGSGPLGGANYAPHLCMSQAHLLLSHMGTCAHPRRSHDPSS